MAKRAESQILAVCPRERFVGRTREIQQLLQRATGSSRGVSVLSTPGAGLSELLRQTYDDLFWRTDGPVPIFFAVKPADENAGRAATRFLHEFLSQLIAFLRRDTSLVHTAAMPSELAKLARPVTGNWFLSAVEMLAAGNDLIATRSKLAVPLRATGADLRCCVIIDDLHEIRRINDGELLLEYMTNLAGHMPVLAGMYRRFDRRPQFGTTIELSELEFTDAAAMIGNTAADLRVDISDQARDLAAIQLGGNAARLRGFLERAADVGSVESFSDFCRIYASEIVKGSIGARYDQYLRSILPEDETRRDLIEYLRLNAGGDRGFRQGRSAAPADRQFAENGELLNLFEMDARTLRDAEAHGDRVFADYVHTRSRIEIDGDDEGVVTAELITESLKRAPRSMARYYRNAAALPLRDVLMAFDGRPVPAALVDHTVFKARYQGKTDNEILSAIASDPEIVELPQIVSAEGIEAYDRGFIETGNADRTFVGAGFIDRRYSDEDEVVWLAAEIDSKLETRREVAEFWCNRLELTANNSGFNKFRIWLISPAGFADDALELLRSRRAYGASRKQAELLIKYLTPESAEQSSKEDEYELVVPMGDETELIAAHALEEVARRKNFPPKAINQIKTALIEACINATEHSASPDRRIYQKFRVEKNKIVITVSNRGIRLTDQATALNEPGTGRRGWGINLMKGLMDEVRVEQVDDGTRISMTKYLPETQ
jgi:serine/threonine-protein kinase RsbW